MAGGVSVHLCGEEQETPGKVELSVNVFEDTGTQRKEENNRRLGRRALQMG